MNLRPTLFHLLCGSMLALALLFTTQAAAESRSVAPRGIYAQIDTRGQTQAIQALSAGSPGERQATMDAIRSAPGRYAPPVFFVLSEVLFDMGEEDEGAFWFYAGQLRARFDANRCADVSARQAVSGLSQRFGPRINQYAFGDVGKLEALVPRVIEWDRNTPHDYDHRWINLHGMGAMMSALDESHQDTAPLSLPEDQWSSIAEKTRTDYLDGFRQALAQLKSMAE